LLKILSRITSPSTGDVRLKGRIGSLLEVGTGFHPEMTGRENIYMNGTVLGMRRFEISNKFDQIVDFAGVSKYVDTPVKRYSSGMMVRLGFAVAAFLEPEILIVDEVLAVGDADFQNRAMGKLETVGSKGRTVLFVSHNMGSIARICKTGIILNNGTMHFQGEIKKAVDSYLAFGASSRFSTEDREFGFHFIEVQGETGEQRGDFKYGEPIAIYLTGKIPAINGIVCSFSLYDKRKRILFSNLKSIGKSSDSIFKIKILIPKDTLLPGRYYLNFSLHVPNIEIIDQCLDTIAFDVTETGSDFYMFNGLDYGSVNIPIRWETA